MRVRDGRKWEARLARPRRLLRDLAWHRLPIGALGIGLGLLALGATLVGTMSAVDDLYNREGIHAIALGPHLKKLVVALPFLALGLLVPARWLRREAFLVYGLCLAGLALVPFVGIELNGARRWIAVPLVGFDLQPSEFAKLGVIVALARVLHTNRLRRWRDWVRPTAIVAVPMAMVAAQPDLGTALTLVPVAAGLFWLAGASGRRMAGLVAAAAAVAVLAVQSGWIQDYQLRRVETWAATYAAEPLIDQKNGPSFHVYHARVAIGNGGAFGTGLGRGVAAEVAQLPERESDSIVAVAAEQGGFLGTLGLLALYAGLTASLLRAAGRVRERFTRFVVGGVALYFAAHFFVNVAVNLGLLPMTGLTLPLLSTGGSSLLATCLALGLASGLAARHEPALDRDAFRD